MLQKMDIMVIAISATRVDGIFLVIIGNNLIRMMVEIPKRKMSQEIPSEIVWGNCVTILKTVAGDFFPMRGYICCRIMMMPIPLIKPDKTG